MDSDQRDRRRVVFDEVPGLYDSVRPGYPPRLFDDLFCWLGKAPGDVHIVEMGPGTGQATIPLLRRGCRITAVELGSAMADYLRSKTAEFGDALDVVTGPFEDVHLPGRAFDLVFAATAWHWIDPTVGLPVASSLLRVDGAIALLGIIQVADEGGRDFFLESEAIHRDLGIGKHPWRGAPRRESAFDEHRRLLEESRLFKDVDEFRADWDISYTAEEYVRLKQTHSDIRVLSEPIRAQYLSRIADLIDGEFQGSIVRPGVACLCVARVA